MVLAPEISNGKVILYLLNSGCAVHFDQLWLMAAQPLFGN
jgi:hypothetical protein